MLDKVFLSSCFLEAANFFNANSILYIDAVQLWDMTAGKQLAAFRQHSGPVNTIQFHPNDLLLASGSSDR